MTQFNMSELFKNVQNATANSSNHNSAGQNRKYPYPSVYVSPKNPTLAQLYVRILPNQKDAIVTTQFRVHKTDKITANCGLNDRNNPVCEACAAVQEVKDATGVIPKAAAQNRGALFAQYVRSVGYEWTDKYPEPKPGDIILVQGPASLHQTVNNMLNANGPEGMNEILFNVSAPMISIARDSQGKQMVATALIQRVNSAASQEAYIKLLADMPSLNDSVLFGGIDETDRTKLNEIATGLRRTLRPTTVGVTPDTMAASVSNGFGGIAAQPTQSTGFSFGQPVPPVSQPQQGFGMATFTPAPSTPAQSFGFAQPTPEPTLQVADTPASGFSFLGGGTPTFNQGVSFQPGINDTPGTTIQAQPALVTKAELHADFATPAPSFGFTPQLQQAPSTSTLDALPAVELLKEDDKDRLKNPNIPPFCPKKHNGAQICKMCVLNNDCPFKTA